MSDTLIEEDVFTIPYEDTGENNITHIINPPMNVHIWQPGMTAQDVVGVARATGQYIITLCEKKFKPVNNPERFPACDECVAIAGNIMREIGQ